MKVKLLFAIFLIAISHFRHSHAKSLPLTKLTRPLPVTFPDQKIVTTEKRVIIKQFQFACPGTGLFANDHNCEEYYQCDEQGKATLVKCQEHKLWNDKLKTCTDPVQSTCATLKVITRNITSAESAIHVSQDKKVLYRLVGDRLGDGKPIAMGDGYHLIKRVKLVPTEQIELLFTKENVPKELIEYYEKIRSQVPSYFLEIYEIRHSSDMQMASVIELVELYKSRTLTPLQLIQYYVKFRQIPKELIVYYQKHPLKFESDEQRIQLGRSTEEEILEDLANKKLIMEQLLEIYIKLGRLPEKVVLWIQQNNQMTDPNNDVNKEVSILIDNYKKNLLQPIHLVEYYIAHKELPNELIVYYHKHPTNLESEEVRVQLTRLSLEQILEDMKNNKLLTSQLIEFYIKEKRFPQQIITWFQTNQNGRSDDNEHGKSSIGPDQLIEWYKQKSLQPIQLIQYYLFAHTIPQQLIVYYQQNPPQFETEEQRKQMTRISVEEIIEDFKSNRLIPSQLIELFVKEGKIPREIIALFETKHKPDTEVVVDEQDQLIVEAYKTNKLTMIELIKYVLKNRKLPEQLIVYYQNHKPHLESEEQKIQLTRLTIEQIIEDIQNNKLVPAQLISFYIKQGQFSDQLITIFEQQIKLMENGGKPEEESDDRPVEDTKGTKEAIELIELYKLNKLEPIQLIKYYITNQKIPQELIVYYQKHPPQFKTEEQKIQLTRLSIEEILEDLKNQKLHLAQLIEFYVKQGRIDEQIITWFKKHNSKTGIVEPVPDTVAEIDAVQLVELYKQQTLKPGRLIEYFIATKKIPQELIVYYQKHPIEYTEEQKIQLTRLSIEEILEDLKGGRLLLGQLIECYLKQGTIPDQVVVWYQKHRPSLESMDQTKEGLITKEKLIDDYKNNVLKPSLLIEFFITKHTIPQELIVYYQKHPIEYTEEQKIQLTRLTIEEIIEDLKSGRLLPAQLIEFYLKHKTIPEQIVVWYQKHKTTQVVITEETLIENYKNKVLTPSQLIEFFITKHTIPQQLIVYYQKHPIEYTEEQKIQLTRLSIEEILEDMKNGRLLPGQLIEFYLKQGQIPDQVVVWYQKHKSDPEIVDQTKVIVTEEQLIDNYKNHVLKPFQLIEFFITKHTIPQELIVYYQKHPIEYTEEQKVQLTRLSIEEILEDMQNGRLLPAQLIEFYLKQGTIPQQVVIWYQKHRPKEVVEEETKQEVVITEQQLIDNYKKRELKPTQLIEFFITKHTIPQELIVYYQKHRPKFESEEQKVQMTRLTIEEILEDLKRGRLTPYQLIEFYVKRGTIPEQVVLWYQKHRPSIQVVVKPEVLIEEYKEHRLDPIQLIRYYLTTHRIPQQLIVYYTKHPELISQEERTRISRVSIEQIIDDLNHNRLLPAQLIEFYLRRGQLPKQVIVWFQKNRPNYEVTSDTEQVVITKQKLIDDYKNHVLKPTQLIQFFITQQTIPEELIVYYRKHPPTFESEEQRIQLTRLTIEEILEDFKGGRLIPAQLIEFYLKQGTIPSELIVWYQEHRPSHRPVVKPSVPIQSNILIELLKKGTLDPNQFIEYYLETGHIPEDFLIYYRKSQRAKPSLTKEERYQLKRLNLEQILEDLETKRLIISQLIEFYIRQKRIPDQVIITYQKLKLRPVVRPDSDSQTRGECKAYFSEGDDELELSQLCGTSCSTDTFTIAHPKSQKKYIVCNLQINHSVKHVIRKCSHGLVFDKVYRTCEKQLVVDQCSSPVGSSVAA